MSSVLVGATTLSGDDLDDGQAADDDEIVWELTDDEVARELNAFNQDGGVLSTEASGKKFLFLGDSIACGYNDPSGNYVPSFVHFFSQYNSASITNKAVGGATYSTSHTPNVMTELKEVKVKDYDAVFLFFGANDFSISRVIGDTKSNDTNTVCGALNKAIETCQTAGVKCYVILPFPCQKQFKKNNTNTNGYTYTEYVGAIQSVAKSKGATIIDFQSHFGINADNYGANFVDSVHPAAHLQMLAGAYINEFLVAEYQPKNVERNDIAAFIDRLYQYCLLRDADMEGARFWYDAVSSKTCTGADVAKNFFFSPEFTSYNYSDRQYLELLYKTMMNRTADEDGMSYWLDLLDTGVSRTYVFREFSESKEFTEICNQYGIDHGSVTLTEGRDQNLGLTKFVSRLYTKALGRSRDLDGLNYWCGQVASGAMTIPQVSTDGFFHSEEFKLKGLSNEEYIKVLYRTFMGREYDDDGLAYWKQRLNSGSSRDDILYEFANSAEFTQIKQSYGMK